MASRANAPLSSGQLDCLHLVAQNLTSKEIAAHLGVSPHTVDQRIRRALRQLGTDNRRHAARMVVSAPRMAGNENEASETKGKIAADFSTIPLPIATAAHPTNTMGVAARLLWIVAIAMSAAMAMGMYVAGLESLSRLLSH